MQKRLCPQGTRAATISLSEHIKHWRLGRPFTMGTCTGMETPPGDFSRDDVVMAGEKLVVSPISMTTEVWGKPWVPFSDVLSKPVFPWIPSRRLLSGGDGGLLLEFPLDELVGESVMEGDICLGVLFPRLLGPRGWFAELVVKTQDWQELSTSDHTEWEGRKGSKEGEPPSPSSLSKLPNPLKVPIIFPKEKSPILDPLTVGKLKMLVSPLWCPFPFWRLWKLFKAFSPLCTLLNPNMSLLPCSSWRPVSMPFVWKSSSFCPSITPPVRMAMWLSISSLALSTFSGSPVTSNTGSLSRLGVTM